MSVNYRASLCMCPTRWLVVSVKHVCGMGPHQRSRTLVVGSEGFLIHICIAYSCLVSISHSRCDVSSTSTCTQPLARLAGYRVVAVAV
eukprot:9083-Heterococcus_DN1.PRE.2